MITVGDPWAAAGDDVPGALPAGVYVRVLDDGHELALVQLDAAQGATFVREDETGWYPSARVGWPPDAVCSALAVSGQSIAELVVLVEHAQARGISPFGE